MSSSSTKQPTRQFGRALKLEVSNGKEGIIISNLRVTFDIQKGNAKHPNKATITVFNLTESNRYKLASGEWDYVRLSVGYGLTDVVYRQIFEGDITRTNDQRNGMDIQTVLECADALKSYTNGFMSATLTKGSTHDDLVDMCLASMPKVDEGFICLDNNIKPFMRARTMFGQTHQVLDQIAGANNATWSIQDNKLNIIPNNGYTDAEVIVLSVSSGMVGAPRGTDKGLEVTCNLNPTLSVGGLVQVNSMFTQYDGQYKIDTVRFRGDNKPKGPWLADLTLLGGDFAKKVRRLKKPRKKSEIQYDYVTEPGVNNTYGR
ncbi:baseplate hub [Salmonella phage ZCSE2]|uniref:Tail protein n=2 Tax=Loughboroughvirus ZCSE2 TaxID=2734117 RepID=A0A4D6DVX0_9CAUD|nr:baseplate hub [Salmonella phage ZCSE2]QBZ70520.1 hypothetical protein [Salmonella phage ZCSE2]QMV47852.1 putative baseplate protein 1 [Salmonella phage S144]